MERLVQRNYFDDSRKDEHIMVQVMGFDASEVSPAGDDCEVFVETGYSSFGGIMLLVLLQIVSANVKL
ncbi:hypothetical protein OROHE_018263 [Orobanche hederae]